MSISYDWFELRPDAGAGPIDPGQATADARGVTDVLGLVRRPGLTSLDRMGPVDGALFVASGSHRWLAVPNTLTKKSGKSGAKKIADTVARAAHAVAGACSEPAILGSDLHWQHAYVPGDVRLASGDKDRQTQQTLQRLDIPAGEVAVYSIRRVRRYERRFIKDWTADQVPSQHDRDAHPFSKPGLAVCRVSYGAPDASEAGDGAANAASALDLGLSGFGSHPSHPCAAFAWGATGTCLPLAALCAWGAVSGWKWLWVPFALALLVLAWAWIRWMNRPPAWAVRPRHRWLGQEKKRKGSEGDMQTSFNDGERKTDPMVTAWSWQASSIPFTLSDYAIVAAPPAGTQTATAGISTVPDALRGATGPVIGLDSRKQPVRLDAGSVWQGVMLFGEPGGGKSNSLHGLLGWDSQHLGKGDALVDFESKGADSIPILRRVLPPAPRTYVCELSDPTTFLPEMLPTTGTPAEKATRFASLMQSALGSEAFAARSRLQTQQALTIILTAQSKPQAYQKACAAAGVLNPPGEWIEGACVILGSRGADQARALAKACATVDPTLQPLVDGLQGGMSSTGRPKLSDSVMLQTLSAPANKFAMLDVPQLLGRRPISWAALLSGNVLVINLGTGSKGQPQLPEATRDLCAQLMFQSLRNAIEAGCYGWQAKGRKIVVSVDELTDVVGGSGNTDAATGNEQALEWMRDKGRAYGVQILAGTQNPSQISPRLRASLFGFATLGSYVIRDADMAALMAKRLYSDDDHTNAVESLPRHTIAVSTIGPDGGRVPVLTLRVPWFDDPNASTTNM